MRYRYAQSESTHTNWWILHWDTEGIEHASPRGEPLCVGRVFDGDSCRWGLPLEAQARLIQYFLQFQSALCVPLVAFNIMLGSQHDEFEFVVKVPGGYSHCHVEEDYLVLSHTQNTQFKKNLFTTYWLLSTQSLSTQIIIEPIHWTSFEARHQVFAVQ